MPFTIIRDDITRVKADAIVNAANGMLAPGGGVCGAIHKAAGPRLAAECLLKGGCRTGEAKITGAYKLPAKYVIHAVGPIWGKHENQEELLYSCYKNSMELAREHGCESIAFPLISSGIYGCPKEIALDTAKRAIRDFLESNDMDVILVLFDKTAMKLAEPLHGRIQQYIDDNYVEEHDSPARSLLVFECEEELPAFCEPSEHTKNRSSKEFSLSQDTECAADFGAAPAAPAAFCATSLAERLNSLDLSFSQKLLKLIDESGKTDAQVYKRANIDRKLFSKIRSDIGYRPKKQTVLAFAIALELSLEDTKELLSAAGFALSKSSKADVIVEFFIQSGNYDIYEINDALFAYDQSLIGG